MTLKFLLITIFLPFLYCAPQSGLKWNSVFRSANRSSELKLTISPRRTALSLSLPFNRTSPLSKWEFCPEGKYVYGFLILPSEIPGEPIKGISLRCSGREDSQKTISAARQSGSYTTFQSCPNTENGLAVGFQLRYVSNSSISSSKVYKNQSHGNRRKEKVNGVMDMMLYCDDLNNLTSVEVLDSKVMSTTGVWKEPILCGWGELVCGIRAKFGGDDLDEITRVDMKCCRDPLFQDGPRLIKSYREVKGHVLQSQLDTSLMGNPIVGDSVYKHHYKKPLDHPYYYKWKFCNENNYGYEYVTGFQLHYENHAIRLLCSDMSRAEPRTSNAIQMSRENFWNDEYQDEGVLSEEAHCDGVAIGIQSQYHTLTGIQAVRFFCSFSEDPNELTFVDGRFKLQLINYTHLPVGEWQERQFCGRNQAICGFKALNKKREGTTFYQLEHLKVKCCTVPDIAEVCYPGDKYELLVECDATKAHADTTCSYSQSEGVSMQQTKTLTDQLNEEFHESLAHDWGDTESGTRRETEGFSNSQAHTKSNGYSNSDTQQISESNSTQSMNGESTSNTVGSTQANSVGQAQGHTQGTSSSHGQDSTNSNSMSSNIGNTVGFSNSNTQALSSGTSDSSSSTTAVGSSTSLSNSNTHGISKGTMSSQTIGQSNSISNSGTRGSSQSRSDGTSRSQTSGFSASGTAGASVGVTKSAGVDVGIFKSSLEVNVQAHFSATIGTTSDQTEGSTSTTNQETSNSQTSSVNAEHSSSKMSQGSTDESKSNTFSYSSDRRQDNSETNNKEVNEQKSLTTGEERNQAETTNVGRESASSATDRNMTETNTQISSNQNNENSQSNNTQTGSERTSSFTNSNSIDASRGKTNTLTGETGSQSSNQRSTDKTQEVSRSRSKTKNLNRGSRFTSGFDWSTASSNTYNLEKKFDVEMVVPAGYKAQLFQVVGYCAHYNIRTTKYKRVDFPPNDTEQVAYKNKAQPDLVDVLKQLIVALKE